LIGRAGTFSGVSLRGLTVVPLAQGVELVPLGKNALRTLQIPSLPLTDEANESLPAALDQLCKDLSKTAELAYIEAESFGGAGMQAFALYRKGGLVEGPIVGEHAINDALKALGVESNVPEQDEFDVVGLGKHRGTDQWK
jgi:hypothetical protein